MSHDELSELERAEARALLARALGEEPTMTNEPETVLASAKRSLLRGRVLLTTGVVAGVLTVGFGTTALAGGFSGGTVQPAGVTDSIINPEPGQPQQHCDRPGSILELPPCPTGSEVPPPPATTRPTTTSKPPATTTETTSKPPATTTATTSPKPTTTTSGGPAVTTPGGPVTTPGGPATTPGGPASTTGLPGATHVAR